MKRIFKASIVLLLLVMMSGIDFSISQTAMQNVKTKNAIYTVRDSILSYFPPLNGEVVEVENGIVKIKLKKGMVRRGMRLSVFRKGVPFYHPVTKELIGKIEEPVGRIEVETTKPENGLYPCRIIRGDIKPDDIVRITSSRIKLAFFQERNSDWALSELFYESLKDSDRFDILETYTSTYEPEKLSELSKKLDAEAFLILSTPSKEEKRFLSVRLFWTEDTKIFAKIEEPVSPELFKALTPAEEFISAALAEAEPWGSYRLAGGELIAMGDVDGNGLSELVVSDGNNIRIYSFKEEPRELWVIKGSPKQRHLSIDILDLNNNGRSEIFVTSLIGEDKMSSFVVEYDLSQGYTKIWGEAPYFLRVLGKVLLMQRFDSFEIFSGPVYRGEWRDGYYLPSEALKLPQGVNIYGFTFVDWQKKGSPQLITFDDAGYLNLYDVDGHLVWKSNGAYGKFNLSFKRKTYSVVNPIEEWFIRDKLFSVNTERGQEVIVIKKIPVLKGVPGLGVKEVQVYSLWWDGTTMEEELIVKGISGAITDYWLEKNKLFLIAKGNFFTFIKKITSGEFSKGSILYYYNFTP